MGLDFAQSTSANPLKSLAPAPPPSRRYSDKRRYTSKVAARERRSVESDLLHDLGRSLPITQFALNSLDKISILRLAVTNLKLRSLFEDTNSSNTQNGQPSLTSAAAAPAALIPIDTPDDLLNGGFLIVLSATTGDVIYVSESISGCLGLTSYEVAGKSIYDYTCPDDRDALTKLLALDRSTPWVGTATSPQRTALIRLKCNLFPHINPLHFRPVSNKVIHFTGKMYLKPPIMKTSAQNMPKGLGPCFIGVGRTIPHPADNNYPFPSMRARTFTSLHSIKDLAFIRADPRVEEILRFTPSELINTKGTDLVHSADALPIMANVHDLHTKGQTLTKPFRFLAKGGGWVWMITEGSTLFTSSYRANTLCPASAIFCRNIVISEIETDQILSLIQLPSNSSSNVSVKGSYVQEMGMETDSGNESDLSASYSPGVSVSSPESIGTPEQLMNMPPAGLFQEFLHSGSDSDHDHDHDSESNQSASASASPSPSELIRPRTFSLTLIKDEILEDEDLRFFGSIEDADVDGGELDFTALPPEFATALDQLFVEGQQFIGQQEQEEEVDVKPYIPELDINMDMDMEFTRQSQIQIQHAHVHGTYNYN